MMSISTFFLLLVYKRKLLWSTKGEISLARCIVVVVVDDGDKEEERRNKTVSEKRIHTLAQKRKNANKHSKTNTAIPPLPPPTTTKFS